MQRKQFTFYRSYYDAYMKLSKSSREPFITALMEYALFEKKPKDLNKTAAFGFDLVKPTIDSGRRQAAYRLSKSDTFSEINEKENEDEDEDETENETDYENEYEGHTLPTKSDVEKYVTRKRYSVDPTAFFKYYEAMGWRVNGKPVANWQALVDYWAHMDSGKSNSPNAGSTAFLSKDEIKAILNNKNQ